MSAVFPASAGECWERAPSSEHQGGLVSRRQMNASPIMSSNRRMHNWFLCGNSDKMENDKWYIFLLKIKTWHRLSAKPREACCLRLQAGINYSDWKMCLTIFYLVNRSSRVLGKPSKYWITTVGHVWVQFSPAGKWTERLCDKQGKSRSKETLS